ncbi:MAG TPA: PH domain-containing protein [Patescibacteria group bacterium]
MEENQYQKLGLRTLFYDIVTSSQIALMILILTLIPVFVKNYSSPSAISSGFYNLLGTLIYWGSLATLAVFVITILVSYLKYSMFKFRLDADIFKINRGVFSKEEIAIPYRRIESVDIRRNLIHQLFGVSRINIETTIDSESTGDSKQDSSDEVFPAIDSTLARKIQEELTTRANVQKMRI